MATKKEIESHLKIALDEIGEIKPWFDKNANAWVFGNQAYPVEYADDSREAVIEGYPLYLREFIKQRLNDNLAPLIEKRTKGRGGIREGAGRPKGSIKGRKKRVSLPEDIANWISQPESISSLRRLIANSKH